MAGAKNMEMKGRLFAKYRDNLGTEQLSML
jgi:hypothetical protein